MKKTLLAVVLVAAAGGAAIWYTKYRQTPPKVTVTTVPITRGDVVDTVGATGTLQAVTTVQVGTQVSGTIQELYADFNSLVRKGQVLARLDPSLFQTQIEQARANLIRAEADLDRLRVSLDDARTKLTRTKELAGRQLLPKSDLDTAEVNVRSVEAQIRSAEAQVTQAQASLNQNQVNLEHTVIEAPIDGLVISRSVDVGQTVAASMQAPTLFVLAADLTKMQVVANLDESDVGRIRPNQQVSFRVDAYPTDTFRGSVSQVRLEPKVQQNVVTYATVIDVPNGDLRLKPGMTANVTIEIARSANVLRVATSALRFRPTAEMYAALGQTPPDPATLRESAGGRRPDAAPNSGHTDGATEGTPLPGGTPADGRGAGAGAAATAAPQAGVERGRGARAGSPDTSAGGDNASRLAERMANLSPEQRERMQARMREGGFDPAAGGRGRGNAASGNGERRAPAANRQSTTPATGQATTIDALFGPLPRIETQGRLWVHVNNQLLSHRVRVGISDGQQSELLDTELGEGTEVVTNVSTGGETRPAATSFPFGQPGRGGFPGAGGGFPGGNRGGANTGRGR